MNEKVEIKLEFKDQTLPSLSGDDYGEEVYMEQVQPKVKSSDFENGFIITFPDYISIIGASFLQGFCRQLINKIGYDGIQKKIIFKTSSEELTQEVYDDIY